MGINYYGITDVGLKRSNNQDCFKICEMPEGLLMVVCDGMGGAAGGSEASSLAASSFVDYVKTHIALVDKEEYLNVLQSALDAANEIVCSKARASKELEGMGTTLVCALYDKESYYCLWVGDSRIYALNSFDISQLSHDHSFVQNLIDSGRITKDEAKHHPNRNIITKAVGIEQKVKGDVCKISAEKLEGMLLCSDGLCGYVPEDVIEVTCREKENIEDCCKELVKLANDNGGHDNITVVIHRKQ